MKFYVFLIRWDGSGSPRLDVMTPAEKKWFEDTFKGKWFKDNTRFVGEITADTKDEATKKAFDSITVKDMVAK